MKNQLINAMTDEKFRLRAFSDYCLARQEAYSELLAMQLEAIEVIPDDDELTNTMSENPIEDLVGQILSAHPEFNANQYVLVDDGYITLHDYLYKTVELGNNYISTGDATKLYTDKVVPLIDAAHNTTNSITLDDLNSQVKNSLHSLSCLVAANQAMLCENVADRITVFNDVVQQKFSNVYSDVSNTASYLKGILQNCTNTDQYLNNISQVLGVNALAADNSEAVPNSSDISQYTGSSPIGALSFASFGSAVSSVVNAGVKIVSGVLGSVFNLAKGVFSKISNWFHKTVIDPYDIEEVNKDAESYTVDGWCYHYSKQYEFPAPADFDPTTDIEALRSKLIGHIFKFDTIFAETCQKPSKIQYQMHYGDDSDPWQYYKIYVDCEMEVKPKSISKDCVDTITNYFNIPQDQVGYVPGRVKVQPLANMLNELKEKDIYMAIGDDERALYTSFYCAIMLNSALLHVAYLESMDWWNNNEEVFPADNSIPLATWNKIYNDSANVLSTIGNIDFLSLVTGYNPADGTFHPEPPVQIIPITTSTAAISGLIVSSMIERLHDPAGFTFIPFRDNKETFSSSRYRIKTDQENNNAFNTFINIALAVVIVAVVGIAATIVVKKIARKVYIKRMSAKGVLDQKMWNGEKLTAREMKKYCRLERKLGITSSISSGLQDAVTSVASSSISTAETTGVSEIVSLIR